jgi:hypothetical protein
MAKLTVSGGGVSMTDGVYEATLLHVEVCEPAQQSPYQNPWLKWIFTVYDGSQDGTELSAASSLRLGPKAKARSWVEALLRRRLEIGEEIDTDSLSMLDCQLLVKTDPETQFVKVMDVMQARVSRPTVATPAAASGVTV